MSQLPVILFFFPFLSKQNMPDDSSTMVKFGPFTVTNQVFYRTKFSFALVNLKPILPGHVLVCPRRVTSRVLDLSPAETADFFHTVRTVSAAIERAYEADSLNIAIQDGPLAGQTVPHVHCHIIPRRLADLPNVDEVYARLNGREGDLEWVFRTVLEAGRADERMGRVDEERGGPRSEAVMGEEARRLAKLFEQKGLAGVGEQQ